MSRESMMRKLGLSRADFEPHNKGEETDAAIVELAEMVAEQEQEQAILEQAILELAEMIGGAENG